MPARQLSLWEGNNLNVEPALKDALRAAVAESGLSRDQVVDRMNELATHHGVRLVQGNGQTLSLDTFEKWLNQSEPGRAISIRALTVFCAAVGDHRPIAVLCRPLGFAVIGPDDANLLEWARLSRQAKATRTKIRELEARL